MSNISFSSEQDKEEWIKVNSSTFFISLNVFSLKQSKKQYPHILAIASLC